MVTVFSMSTTTGPESPSSREQWSSTASLASTTRCSRDVGGSGIGLAIVKEVVEAHDGTAVVGDNPLGGARFTVTLPTASPGR